LKRDSRLIDTMKRAVGLIGTVVLRTVGLIWTITLIRITSLLALKRDSGLRMGILLNLLNWVDL